MIASKVSGCLSNSEVDSVVDEIYCGRLCTSDSDDKAIRVVYPTLTLRVNR